MRFLAAHQLNLMLALSGACAAIIFLLIFTRSLTARRKIILISLLCSAMALVSFDRLAYIYSGIVSKAGYRMVRVSNFIVFFMTAGIVLSFSLYVADLLMDEGRMKTLPKRIRTVVIMSVAEMVMVVISQFTGLYYYFDEFNKYHRGKGFLLSYIIPVSAPIILFTVIWQYRKLISRFILVSLFLFIYVPIIAALIQIWAYGLSLVNIAMVLVAMSVYVFAYLDLNDKVERAKRIEIDYLKENRNVMYRLFKQIAAAFVNAVDAKGLYSAGHSERVANYSSRLASMNGKSEEECDRIYYTALLHDVGKIRTHDSILEKDEGLTEEELEEIRKQPLIGNQILSGITDFPGIGEGAHYYHERYDGAGYPEGLKGEDIPEAARIIAIADAYDTMTTPKSYRDPLPQDMVREAFVREAGAAFDPDYARLMVQMIDEDPGYQMKTENSNVDAVLHDEFVCEEYRSTVSYGIRIMNEPTVIRFKSEPTVTADEGFSAPSVILFDSQDRRVHDTVRTIDETRYTEYGELWFDGHNINNGARNMKTVITDADTGDDDSIYEIETFKNGDHIRVLMRNAGKCVDVIAALIDNSRYAYVGLTGENCRISDIDIETGAASPEGNEIPRIAEEVSYIERLESDVPNVQVDGYRTAATAGIPVRDGLKIAFHTMSLPSANLVWHCPYIILFYSDDGLVYGEGYREYALIRLDGEIRDDGDKSENDKFCEHKDDFTGWEDWKELNQKGYETSVSFRRFSGRITTITENFGVSIENTTTILDKEHRKDVYVAITGDLVALTDIRIHQP